MVGASARLSCLCTPVETVTSPRERPRRERGARRGNARGQGAAEKPALPRGRSDDQTFFGSGYSVPKVSTVTFFMTWGTWGRSL